ncbi:hypothetical protein D5086_002860 [Populus alba]|uniref:Uncharacterized protein n=1 Tax=Populus alba TaxID=43335 RepID=A0ACC4D309_POPAL
MLSVEPWGLSRARTHATSCNQLLLMSRHQSLNLKKLLKSFEFEQSSLTPPSLNLPAVKFELDGDVEVQSPDSSMWESFFTDNFDSDFMISSPVRNLPSPQTSSYNHNYSHAMQGQSLSGCSPPRYLSLLGAAFSSIHKGKGQSPLHRMCNSPNNQFMQVESLSLPVPAMLDCLTIQNPSRFCTGSVSETSSGSPMTQESDIYQMGSVGIATSSQQLLQENQQQPQPLPLPPTQPQPPPITQSMQQQQQSLNHTLMDQDSGLQLLKLLLACAEAVSNEDYMLARRYLHHLNRVVSPLGDSMQRVASCFTEALSARLAATLTIAEELVDLKPHMFNRRVGEALAVNSVNRLHRVPENCLGNLLAMIRDQAPNIVTVIEQEASHNGPYFLGRFLEALHYYSAIFDSLDATFPPDSSQRAKVEQYIFAPEIRNIVACEGAERFERHERLEKWRKLMEGKGFKGVPLSANAVTQSKILLGLYSSDGYRLTEDKGCLLLEWQDRTILAASAWRC